MRLRTTHVPLPAPTPVWDPYTQQLVIKTFKDDRQRVTEYFVKWRGLAYTSATWEDEGWVLANANQKVRIFYEDNDVQNESHAGIGGHCRRLGDGPIVMPKVVEMGVLGVWGNYLCRGRSNPWHMPRKTTTSTLASLPPSTAWGAYLCRGNIKDNPSTTGNGIPAPLPQRLGDVERHDQQRDGMDVGEPRRFVIFTTITCGVL